MPCRIPEKAYQKSFYGRVISMAFVKKGLVLVIIIAKVWSHV
jgi:hypothetical protein